MSAVITYAAAFVGTWLVAAVITGAIWSIWRTRQKRLKRDLTPW